MQRFLCSKHPVSRLTGYEAALPVKQPIPVTYTDIIYAIVFSSYLPTLRKE